MLPTMVHILVKCVFPTKKRDWHSCTFTFKIIFCRSILTIRMQVSNVGINSLPTSKLTKKKKEEKYPSYE